MSNEKANDGKLKKTMSKNKRLIIIISTIIVLIAGITFGYFMNVKNKVDSWADKIYPGVQAYGIDLGGKTKEEAVNILNDQLISLIGNKIITVTVGDKTFELKYSDISPSVSADETVEEAFNYGKDNKKDTALKIVAALSYIALNNLDRVNISTMNNGVIENLKTGTGNRGFQKILRDLENITFDGTTDLSESIKKRPLNLRGISIVVSDFLNNSGLESLEAGLKYLAYKKQEIILVQVLCEEEINPEFNNEITLIDSETGENIKLSVTPSLIKDYKETLKKYNDSIEALARKYGGKLITVNSSMNIEEIILNEFSKRKVLY